MERSRGSRVTFNARLCTFAIINTTKMNIASFKGYLKGKSSMMIFKDLANLRYKYGNSNFWATGYYVSTVGLNEETIRKYIRNQEKEDVLEDKLTKITLLRVCYSSKCVKAGREFILGRPLLFSKN